MTREEVVKTIDGKEMTVNVAYISYQVQGELRAKHMKMGIKGDEMIIENADIFSLQVETLKKAGVPVEKLMGEEGDKLFNKYFSHILGNLGDDQKNLNKTSTSP